MSFYTDNRRRSQWRDRIFAALGVIVALVAGGMMFDAMVQEKEQWDTFATTHRCKVTAHSDRRVDSLSGTSGSKYMSGSVTTQPTTTYQCDDGVTYTRSDQFSF